MVPTLGTVGAGAYDLYAAQTLEVDSSKCRVNTGWAMEIPAGYRVIITPRSSIAKSQWVLQNSPAIIDSDYRGEIILMFAKIYDNSRRFDGRFPWMPGDRIAQMYIEKIIPINFILSTMLLETERGDGGFGSTGK